MAPRPSAECKNEVEGTFISSKFGHSRSDHECNDPLGFISELWAVPLIKQMPINRNKSAIVVKALTLPNVFIVYHLQHGHWPFSLSAVMRDKCDFYYG